MSGGDIVEFESRRSRGDDEDLVSIEKKKHLDLGRPNMDQEK